MMKKIKKILRIFILILIIGLAAYCHYQNNNINNVAKGEFVESVISLDGKHILNSYFCDGGPLTANGLNVEVVDLETGKSWNIYCSYREEKIEMKWIDNETVIIKGKNYQDEVVNEKILNIYKDEYYWVNDRY